MSDNFLDSFNASLDNLVQFNDKLAQAITSDKESKDDFLQYVNTELVNINNQIQSLEGLIRDINIELNKLRAASDNNTTIISDNNNAKAALEQKIKELQDIEADLKQQLMEANKKSEQLQTELQRQIDDKEAEISKLNLDNQSLKSQSDALQKQLDERGQSDADQAAAIKKLTDEQAAAIQKLTEEHKAALDNQMTENNAKISQLTTEIEERDKKIDELTNNSSSQLSSIQAELEQCKQAQAESVKQIEVLTSENQTLKEQNEQYKKSIEAATLTINETVSKLNEILKQIPNAQDRTAITALFAEINKEIEKLRALLSGQQAVTQTAVNTTQRPSSITPISKSGTLLNEAKINIDGVQLPLGGIVLALQKKSRDLQNSGVDDTKYGPAKDELMKATSKDHAEAILQKYDIRLTDDKKIKGGKTKKIYRKHKKSKMHSKRKNQKGGFTYNKHNMLFGKKKTSRSYKSTAKSSIARGRKSVKKSNR